MGRVEATNRIVTRHIPYGLSFDGVDDRVVVPHDVSLNITEAITFSAWVYLKGWGKGSDGKILDKTYNTGFSWRLFNSGGERKMTFLSSDNGINQSSNPNSIELNKWQHLVVTYDRQNVKFYNNGVYVGGGGETGAIGTNSDPLYIGDRSLFDKTFDGIMTDIRIYNKALTAQEVSDIYYRNIIPTGVVAAYFNSNDDGGGSALKDTSGNDNHGTITSAIWTGDTPFKSRIVTRKMPYGLKFDGVGDFVDCGSDESLDIAEKVTINLFLKSDLLASQKVVVSRWQNGGQYSFILDLSVDKLRVVLSENGSDTACLQQTDKGLEEGQWYNITVVYDGALQTVVFYVNGLEVPSTVTLGSVPASLKDSSDSVRIGATSGGFFKGNISDVRIYGKALSAQEVSDIYYKNVIPTGAVAEYFKSDDDGAGSELKDISGNDNHGAITGAKWTGDTPHKQLTKVRDFVSCGKFNGSSDFIDIDSVLDDLATSTKGTWGAWVKPADAMPVASEIFIAFGDTNALENLQFYIDTSGKLNVFFRIAGNAKWHLASDNAMFSNNVWTHIAIIQNGTEPVLYVNGIAVAQTFVTSIDKTAWFNDASGLDNGRIGNRNYSSGGETQHFDGLIDEVCIYDEALSAKELADIYYNNGVITEDLKCHINFNDNVLDQSGNGNNGVLHGVVYDENVAFKPRTSV